MTGIILLGSECTGTKITAESIIKCMNVQGVVEGWPGVITNDKPLLFRRSHPHGRPPEWPTPSDCVARLRAKGCDNFKLVLTVRDFYSCVRSHQRQDRDGHERVRTDEELLQKIRSTYQKIFHDLCTESSDLPYFISSYESLIADPELHLQNLANLLEVEYLGMNVTIRNENKKYKDCK